MKYFFSALLLFILTSCVNDIDLDQAENLQLSPVVESNLAYFNIEASRFLDDSNNEINTIQDYTDIDLFTDEFTSDNLIRTELLFEFTNSLSRAVNLTMSFLDESDNVVHIISVVVAEGSVATPVVTTHTEVFENSDLDNLKLTKKLQFTITLQAGVTPMVGNEGELKLRSKGTFFFNVETN